MTVRIVLCRWSPPLGQLPHEPPALPYSAARFRSTVNLTRMGELWMGTASQRFSIRDCQINYSNRFPFFSFLYFCLLFIQHIDSSLSFPNAWTIYTTFNLPIPQPLSSLSRHKCRTDQSGQFYIYEGFLIYTGYLLDSWQLGLCTNLMALYKEISWTNDVDSCIGRRQRPQLQKPNITHPLPYLVWTMAII